MSTGISISSINRIKELAEEKKYAEALEILDTQNLDKSINPQFLRISGEIFRENKRYYDSRRILIKAHQMAPQGTRIIFELIQLYLELGYYSKAKRYYEQYVFYVSPEDTQKEYVEYMVKKAQGAEVKELASILIPILERMPEDRWNYEAMLLYDKLDRKDKALDESRYILENFKDSPYTDQVIAYIEGKLDVDEQFFVYKREEQEEDIELFGDLIEKEEEILQADYIRMYPPEARIVLEAEDKDVPEVKPVKEKTAKEKPVREKKERKKKTNKEKKTDESEVQLAEGESGSSEEASSDKRAENSLSTNENQGIDSSTIKSDGIADEKSKDTETSESKDTSDKMETSSDRKNDLHKAVSDESDTEEKTASGLNTSEELQEDPLSGEEQIKLQREAELDKLLSKKFDAEKLRESAMQLAKTVKDIDTSKAKSQAKQVAASVLDNVKKATDVIGEAVGTQSVLEEDEIPVIKFSVPSDDQIMDGIIESVLEPPKKMLGQVVMNEELDELIPDSIEAMSKEEIADIESKKEEMERLELEALEASLQMEEQKKAKRRGWRKSAEDEPETENGFLEEDSVEEDIASEDVALAEQRASEEYARIKEQYMTECLEQDEPALDTLGFISIVHSDVDANLENDMPDTADMIRQMIDNKEYYSGEDSRGFESKASYQNHGFEVEDFNFEVYKENESNKAESYDDEYDRVTPVRVIFAEEHDVSDFDEMIPDADASAPPLVMNEYGFFTKKETPVLQYSNMDGPEYESWEEVIHEESDEFVSKDIEETTEPVFEDSIVEVTNEEAEASLNQAMTDDSEASYMEELEEPKGFYSEESQEMKDSYVETLEEESKNSYGEELEDWKNSCSEESKDSYGVYLEGSYAEELESNSISAEDSIEAVNEISESEEDNSIVLYQKRNEIRLKILLTVEMKDILSELKESK